MNSSQQSSKQTEQEGEDGPGLEGESFLKKLFKDAKRSLFELTFQMLQGEKIGFSIRVMLIVIETMQLLNFHFTEEFLPFWKNETVTNGDSSANYSTYSSIFYAFSVIMLILSLLFLYVGISIKRKNTHLVVFVNILRISTELLVSILYMPLIHLFLSPLDCSSSDSSTSSTLTMSHFPQVECFGSAQIPLVFLGIICSLLVSTHVGLMTLIFFERRINQSDCCAKSNGRAELFGQLMKLTLSASTIFILKQGYNEVVILQLLIGSFLLFDNYQFNLTHHDELIGKLVTAQHAISLWTSLMLVLARITTNYSFDGASVVWILGIPCVYLIIMMRTEQRYDILLINSNSYDVLSDPMQQLQYINKLISRYTRDKHVQIMLDGFLDHHRNTCIQDECPAKRRITKTTKFSKALRNEKVSEQLIMIYTVLQSMYYFALQKFPNNTKIRILYALYLVDTMRSQQQALQELLNTESERPVFDEEFVIFRYKQVIENDLMENSTNIDGSKDQTGTTDVINELSVQTHERQNIEKSAALHVEFWSQLSEEHPDLGKLSELGFKITIANAQAEDQWNRLTRINTHIPSLMRIYARYLQEIVNDKDGSLTILKKLVDINFKNQSSNKISNLLDLSTDSRPSIVISAEDDSFGLVANINLAAAALSGYSKMEILNRNIKALMPTLYGKHHDQFLESYLATLEPRILNLERVLPMMNKQGYILPQIVLVRHVPSLIHGLQFVSSFRLNRSLKEECSLIVNNDGMIENISSQCITMLKIDMKKLAKKPIPITDCIPSFMENLQAFQTKHGAVVVVQDYSRQKREFHAKVVASDVEFRTFGHQGFIIIIEKLREGETISRFGRSNLKSEEQKTPKKGNLLEAPKSKVQSSRFKKRGPITQYMCISFDIHNHQYVGEFVNGGIDDDHSIVVDDSRIFSSSTQVNRLLLGLNDKGQLSLVDQVEEKEEVKVQKQYGAGIRTLRMINSQFVDIEELRLKEEAAEEEILEIEAEEAEEEEQAAQSKKFSKFVGGGNGDELQDGGGNESGNVFKKKSSFTKFINDTEFLNSKALDVFRTGVFYFIALLAGFAVLNHILITSQLEQIQTRAQLFTSSTLFASDCQQIVHKALQIYLYNQQILPNVKTASVLNSMKETANEMKEMNDFIELSETAISNEHQSLLESDKITLKDLNGSQDQPLKLANQQILAKLNNLIGSDLGLNAFSFSETDFYFLVFNQMNSYSLALNKQSDFFILELQDWSTSKQSQFVLALVLSIICSIVALIALLPFFALINNAQQQVLIMFLDIPFSTVKKLLSRCESFLSCIQGQNDDEASSMASDGNDEEDSSLTMTKIRRRSKKRRNFKISLKNKSNFFIPFFVIILIFEGYFSYSFSVSNSNANNITAFISELNTTASFETFYGFSNNHIQLSLIDPSFDVSSNISLNNIVQKMYSINNQIQKEHSQNKISHDDIYNEAYNMIMMEDSCLKLSQLSLLTQLDCEQFADSSLRQGLALGLSRHTDNVISIQSQQSKITGNTAIDQNERNQILASNENKEVSLMQDIYISVMLRYLVNQFRDSLQNGYDSSQAIRITSLIICIVLIFVIYIALWVPVLNTIAREITRVRSMIFMLPLEIIASVKAIREIFSPFLTKMYND